LQEFHRWAGYFINAQVVHIGYLREHEARQLIEHPVSGFPLVYQPEAGRRVLELTQNHPFLLQLLCSEIVSLKNEQPPDVRRLASVGDVETAVHSALETGSMFFADLQWNQIDEFSRELLRVIAGFGEGRPAPATKLMEQCPNGAQELSASLARLGQKGIIHSSSEGYQFRVELIRRWFAQ
jgi:hypothetical protein